METDDIDIKKWEIYQLDNNDIDTEVRPIWTVIARKGDDQRPQQFTDMGQLERRV